MLLRFTYKPDPEIMKQAHSLYLDKNRTFVITIESCFYTFEYVILIAKFLNQCFPTFSPFATCDNKRFEFDDRLLLKNESLIVHKIHFS